MFVFVLLSWVPFRMHNMNDIVACYRAMFALNFRSDVPSRVLLMGSVAAVLALFVSRNSNLIDWDDLGRVPAVSLGLVAFVALLYINNSTQFLYFQF